MNWWKIVQIQENVQNTRICTKLIFINNSADDPVVIQNPTKFNDEEIKLSIQLSIIIQNSNPRRPESKFDISMMIKWFVHDDFSWWQLVVVVVVVYEIVIEKIKKIQWVNYIKYYIC